MRHWAASIDRLASAYAQLDWNDDVTWLGITRIVVCALFLQRYATQDATLFAMLGPVRFPGMGVLDLFIRAGVPEFFATRPYAVAGVQYAAVASLGMALVGYKARWTLLTASLLCTLLEGCYRLWVGYFFHQYVPALYLLWGITAGHWSGGCSRFSFDPPQDKEAGPRWVDSTTCMYVRRYVWVVVAVFYTCAGVSKLLGEGLGWVDGPALHQGAVRMSTMHQEEFRFWALDYAPADSLVWVFGGALSLLVELAAIAVPFSESARRVVPVGLAIMHMSIMFLMHIDFRDAVAVCLLAYGGSDHSGGSLILGKSHMKAMMGGWRHAGPLVSIVGLHALLVSKQVDFWPLTSVMMFSRHPPEHTSYGYMVASWRLADNTTMPVIWGDIWPEGVWNVQWLALTRRKAPAIHPVLVKLRDRQVKYIAENTYGADLGADDAPGTLIASLLIEKYTVATDDRKHVLAKVLARETTIEPPVVEVYAI